MPSSPGLNLLRETWTHAKLRAVLARHPPRALLPALGMPAWSEIAAGELGLRFTSELRALADTEASTPLPALTDDLYASFHRTGIRVTFEQVYFERRLRLGHVALALLLSSETDPGRDRLATSFLAKLDEISAETSWALPAHIRLPALAPTGRDSRCIDLFCAETSSLMADLLEVFSALIPAPLQSRIRQRLHRDVFQNYADNDFHWLRMTNNWNAVCHHGVIGSALALSDDADLIATMLLRAREALPVFLSGFSADGGCSEGPAYWAYGFGWFSLLNERLEHRTRGELSLFDGDDFIRDIARFGPTVGLSNGHVANFSDCAPSGVLDAAVLAYLGERLDDDACRSAAAFNYRHLLDHGADWTWFRSDFLRVSRWLLRCPHPLPTSVPPPADRFFPDLALLVARGTDSRGHLWEFAAKAGHNAEEHNHNDCGSFLLNIDGRRVLIEIGAPEYVRDYFDSARRYTFLAPRSLGHSVPLVNDHEQHAGATHAAKVLCARLTPDRLEFSMDLSACYPEAARVRRLVRTFVFEKTTGRLTLTDEYEFPEPGRFASMLITLEPPALPASSDHVLLGVAPGLTLRVGASAGTRYVAHETCPFRDKSGKEQQVQRLAFVSEVASAAGRLELVFTLA